MEELYSIGTFAKMTGISAAALRLYHSAGILSPHRTDPDTGYRYYSPSQLDVAELIHLLRRLDVPLPEVKQLLTAADPQDVRHLLHTHSERLRATLVNVTEALERLDRAVGPNGSLPPNPVRLSFEDPCLVVSRRAVARVSARDVSAYNETCARCIEELEQVLARAGVPHSGREIVLHHNQAHWYEGLELEVCLVIPVSAGQQITESWILPGCTVACTRHLGNWSEVWGAYASLMAWIQRKDYAITGPFRVRYAVDERDTSDSSRYVADISVPVERASWTLERPHDGP